MEAELPLVICDGLTISGTCSGTQYYFQPIVDICSDGRSSGDTLDLTGYTLTFNGVNYNTLVDEGVDLEFASYCAVGPTVMGTTGTTYRFDFVIDNLNYELCGEPFSGLTYERIDIILTNYLGETSPNQKEWIAVFNHYLNDVLIFSEIDNIIFISSPISDNPNCPNIFAIFAPNLRFLVKEKILPTVTPTPTPTSTPSSLTPTPTGTPTQTPTTTTGLTPTPTRTGTPTPTPTQGIEIFTHGTVFVICSGFCNTNYQIDVSTPAEANYSTLTIGDTIYGQGGVAGFVAYAATSTDTSTGTFRIAEIDSSGEIIDILVCSGGSCVPL
jgi:hypothetical protein